MDKKIKVLAYCDAPTCATGFATVSRNILMGLYNTGKYDIDIIGINYWGDPHNFPFRIWPAGTNGERDPYGRKKALSMISQMEFDLLFFLQDTFILTFLPNIHEYLRSSGRNFKSIVYYPIDGVPYKEWLDNVNVCDYIVNYSEFGKEQSLKVNSEMKEEDLLVIPHGVNTSDFNLLNEDQVKDFRSKYFGSVSDKFIFTNLNRNQQRKDIPRCVAAFAELHKKYPDTALYLHMAKQDHGWDMEKVVRNFGLDLNKDVIFPENFGPNQGFPRPVVNLIYNASDCVLSTSLGEGWGLSWIEAMATKTPVIMPDNTALTENITEELGFLVKSGADPSHFTVIQHDNEVVRPLVDVNDMVEKMEFVYNNRTEAKRRAENAYRWVVTKMDWQESIVPKWVNLFDLAYSEVESGTKKVAGPTQHNHSIKTESF